MTTHDPGSNTPPAAPGTSKPPAPPSVAAAPPQPPVAAAPPQHPAAAAPPQHPAAPAPPQHPAAPAPPQHPATAAPPQPPAAPARASARIPTLRLRSSGQTDAVPHPAPPAAPTPAAARPTTRPATDPLTSSVPPEAAKPATVTPPPAPAKTSDALRELATRPEFALRSADLCSLAEALDNGESWNYGGWDRVDLLAAFNPASTIHIQPVRRWNHLLGAAAGVVMFLPLIWTWWGLHQATNAYNQLLESQPELVDGVSFLHLWITGFADKLASWHRLGTVTIVSVGLIVVATGVLIGNRWNSERGHREEERRYAEADAELVTLLTAAQRELAQAALTRGASQETLVLSVAKLMEAHNATAEASKRVAVTVETARAAITDSVDQVRLVSTQLAGTTSSFDRAATAVGGAAATVGRETKLALDQLATALAVAADQSQRQIWAAQQQSTTELGKAADGLARVHTDLIATLNDFTKSRELAQSGFASSLAASEQARADMSQDVGKVMSQIRALFEDLNVRLAQVEAVAKDLQDAFVLNRVATQSQVNELTRARDTLEMLAQREFVPQT